MRPPSILVIAAMLLGVSWAGVPEEAEDTLAFHQTAPSVEAAIPPLSGSPAMPVAAVATIALPSTMPATMDPAIIPVVSAPGIPSESPFHSITAMIGGIGVLLLIFRRRTQLS